LIANPGEHRRGGHEQSGKLGHCLAQHKQAAPRATREPELSFPAAGRRYGARQWRIASLQCAYRDRNSDEYRAAPIGKCSGQLAGTLHGQVDELQRLLLACAMAAQGREHPVTVRFAAQLRYRAGQLKLAKQSSKVPGEPAEVVLPCNSSGHSADVLLHLERGK